MRPGRRAWKREARARRAEAEHLWIWVIPARAPSLVLPGILAAHLSRDDGRWLIRQTSNDPNGVLRTTNAYSSSRVGVSVSAGWKDPSRRAS